MWGDGSKRGDDDLKGVEDELGLLLSGEEVFGVLGSLGSGSGFLFVKHDKGGLTGGDVLDESSLSGSERFDGLGGLLDLVGGVRDSGVVVGNLVSAFTHFGGVSVISSLFAAVDNIIIIQQFYAQPLKFVLIIAIKR